MLPSATAAPAGGESAIPQAALSMLASSNRALVSHSFTFNSSLPRLSLKSVGGTYVRSRNIAFKRPRVGAPSRSPLQSCPWDAHAPSLDANSALKEVSRRPLWEGPSKQPGAPIAAPCSLKLFHAGSDASILPSLEESKMERRLQPVRSRSVLRCTPPYCVSTRTIHTATDPSSCVKTGPSPSRESTSATEMPGRRRGESSSTPTAGRWIVNTGASSTGSTSISRLRTLVRGPCTPVAAVSETVMLMTSSSPEGAEFQSASGEYTTASSAAFTQERPPLKTNSRVSQA